MGNRVQRGGTARTAKDLKRRRKRVCQTVPATPTSVTLSFEKHWQLGRMHWDARVKWAAVTLDAAGRALTGLDSYQVELRATDASGVPVQNDGAEHDYWLENRPADETRRVRFQDLPKPKTHYYQARVRALNVIRGGRCWSAWSGWTTATQPVTGATPGPPAPTGVTLSFDKVEGAKRRPWRARSRWNEVPTWTPTDDDPIEGAAQYQVQLAVSNDGGTTTANVRRATIESEATSGTQQASWANIRRARAYRTRVRAVDADGRKGAYSAWTAWAAPGGSFTATVQNLTISNPTPARYVAKWDEPSDPTDVDKYKVEWIRGTSTVVETHYTAGTKSVYDVPRVDRTANHKARVTPVMEVLHTDRDDAAGSYAAEVAATQSTGADTAPAADLSTGTNPLIRTGATNAGFPRCKVEITTGLAIADQLERFLRYGTEIVDTDSFHPATTDAASNAPDSTYNITAPFDGQYLCILHVSWATSGTGRRRIGIGVGIGASPTGDRELTSQPVGSENHKMVLTAVIDLSAGDVLRPAVWQNSGAALNVASSRFTVMYLGDA